MNWIGFSDPTHVQGIPASFLNVRSNPCDGVLYVGSEGMEGTATLSVSDMSGAEVCRQTSALGGTIEVDSKMGVGTTFIMNFLIPSKL